MWAIWENLSKVKSRWWSRLKVVLISLWACRWTLSFVLFTVWENYEVVIHQSESTSNISSVEHGGISCPSKYFLILVQSLIRRWAGGSNWLDQALSWWNSCPKLDQALSWWIKLTRSGLELVKHEDEASLVFSHGLPVPATRSGY